MISSDTKMLLADAHSGDPLKQVHALIELIKLHDDSATPEILDSIQDLTERRYPPTLLTDAPQTREALTVLEQRNALYHGHIVQILNNLAQLEQTA